MEKSTLRIFSYLPNPRVWKAQIAGELCGVRIDVVGDSPRNLAGWLWDFDARPLSDAELRGESPLARSSRRGFAGPLFKTDAFLEAHPFGTVPAAFSPDGAIGIFESNSILRAVARIGERGSALYGRDEYEASRIDGFLDASLVFAREAQVYLLAIGEMTPALHSRMEGAFEFYLDGINRALANERFIAGEGLTLADISFVCDLAQFLHERQRRDALEARGLSPVSDGAPLTYPDAFRHLLELSELPEFAKHIGGYLDGYRRELGTGGMGAV